MALKTERRRIGDSEYEVTQLPATRGRKLLVRLFKTLGPALGELAAGGGLGAGGDSVSRAVQELASRISEDEFEYVVQEMAGTSRVQTDANKWPDLTSIMDLHFAGKYDEMLKWLAFALEVNYSSFFKGLAGVGRPGEAK